MLASNETNLAVDLLSGVAEGRGGTVPLDIVSAVMLSKIHK